MDRAHTKGPWVRDRFGELRGEDGSLVRFRGMANILAGSDTAIARAKANTLLADAAPDMFEALKAARQFIANGIELGFIRMPDADTPDTAHDTLPAVEAALAKAEGLGQRADATSKSPLPSSPQESGR